MLMALLLKIGTEQAIHKCDFNFINFFILFLYSDVYKNMYNLI